MTNNHKVFVACDLSRGKDYSAFTVYCHTCRSAIATETSLPGKSWEQAEARAHAAAAKHLCGAEVPEKW